ncbi:hypothetical protein HPB50_022415 [Hyalomma asiaticum]|uniref:Uncharacterized protein n=1 Tax=Hyalomma asiaticum TaxID=266040 RepID=A0ACB7TDP4_HYAAI|nr:hypothetical protein HPB50_022415 [Hyalomma asiaticum]
MGQARIYRQLLAALLFDCGDALRASRRHQEYLRIADRTTAFIWNLQLAHLRNEVNVKSPAPKHQVHTLEPLDLPPAVIRVLSLGPKFAVEPKRSAHELLSFVHHLSQHAPLGEHDRCVSEGVEILSRLKPARTKLPVKRVRTFLEERDLTVIPADKEGSFADLKERHTFSALSDGIPPEVELELAGKTLPSPLEKLANAGKS